MPLKVVQVTAPLNKKYGGPPVAVLGVAHGLSLNGVQSTIHIAGKSHKAEEDGNYTPIDDKNNNLDFIFYRKHGADSVYGTLPSLSKIFELVNNIKNSDIVILHQVYTWSNVFTYFSCRATGKKYVLMPHGTLTQYQRSQKRLRKALVDNILFKTILSKSSQILVATASEEDDMPSEFKNKTSVVGLGLKKNNLPPSNMYSSSHSDIIYMGRIAPKKRLDIAIRAFAIYNANSATERKFVICGAGDAELIEYYKELVEKLGIIDSVEFKGWVDDSDKYQIYKNARIFILTSEDENFAIAAAEALAHGIPCLVSDKVALSVLIEKYGAGEVFQTLDPQEISKKIEEMLNIDFGEAQERAFKASEEFDWETVGLNWKHALEKSLKVE